ncbi:PEP-CTERM sorting domain-containing protein [Haloferula chungangensis]|uniref:PEP-CTERM sorting domain-containing protein n=1 Tax=Haloferula chungangensis TaxID=1048331 RepID=A0ABW2L9C8_9BACT
MSSSVEQKTPTTSGTLRHLALIASAGFAVTSQAVAAVSIVQSDASDTTVNLTTAGTTDWVKLGGGTVPGSRSEKVGADFIGAVAGGPVDFVESDWSGITISMSWTDGESPNETGAAVTGSLETKGPAADETLPTSITFDVSGLEGAYRLVVYGTAYRTPWSFTAALDGGGESQTITQGGNNSHTSAFTIDFTATAGQTLNVLYQQTSDGAGNADNIGLAGMTLAAIPEPSSFTLLAGSLALCLARRRRS